MRHFATSRHTVMAGAALMLLLSGCAGSPSMDSTTAQPSGNAAPSATPEARPSGQAAPDSTGGEALADTSGTTADATATDSMKRTVTEALTRLASGTPKPATAQVTEVLAAAGVGPSVLQVSQSRTPTGLEADAIEAAVLQGKDCVIGQVREGAVTVTVLPVLASGKCFVGS
ncbi:DUF6993 domain-containing protein [Pseudarthrobacter enclensis]|uniref:DUF6993 domain-containing protein n=1 Tax=Pseudarthrobacter enclensis TaxID=993070 RepID=UPI003EE1D135